MNCAICDGKANKLFEAQVMGKFDTDYYQCLDCLFIKPENVVWLDEAYASVITDCDVGLVNRNLRNTRILVSMFDLLLEADDKVLDVGGGYGLLCRSLRDKGFDAYSTDPYCENLFAVGHEPSEQDRYRVLCAFEVFEHLEDPMEFLKAQVEKYSPDFFCFSTMCFEGEKPAADWHYYAFETGQHISFYHAKTLAVIAEKLGMHYYAIDSAYHLFHKKPLTSSQQRLLRAHTISSKLHFLWVTLKRRGMTLTPEDYRNARNKLIASQTK
ncbi:class I SAM-dependent methyltransferase [bacterium]|nr:class I SAM-dependent methyltransferase [bacterium]